MTVMLKAALAAGGRRGDFLRDLKRGFQTLHDPAFKPPSVAPGPSFVTLEMSCTASGVMLSDSFAIKGGPFALQ